MVVSVTEKSNKNVLIVTTNVPSSSKGASAVLFYQYISTLKAEYSKLKHLIFVEGDKDYSTAIKEYANDIGMTVGNEIIVIRVPKFLQVQSQGIVLSQTIVQVINSRIKEISADVVVAFDIVAAWISNGVSAPHRLVWLGDLTYQTAYYHGLYAARESVRGLFRFPKAWLSSLLWKGVYKQAIKKNDRVLCASHSTVSSLEKLGIVSTYEPYPWPSSPGKSCVLPDTPTFVFFGTLNALGSRSAIHFMLEQLYPRLIKLWGKSGFRILIAGRGGLPIWAKSAFAQKIEIEYLGYVSDLQNFMASCHAVIVPIDVPVGNRSRILTAMAMKTLVVAHQNAAFGNPALKDGETCLLAEGASEFVEAMRRAVENREIANRVILQAKRVYDANFDPKVACARLSGLVWELSQQVND